EHATKTNYSAHKITPDHPAVVKGRAGSPYAIKDYYDVDPDLATDVDKRMSEYEDLIVRTHKAGLKVIMDFVPNHVARSYHSDAKPRGVRDLGADDITDVRFNRDNNFYYLPGEKLCAQFDMKGEAKEDYVEFPCKVTGDDYFANNPGVYQWYETVKLNYGRDYTNGNRLDICPIPSTWNKMRDILLFWAKKKVDGFRCDMAEMVPTEFWEWVIPQVKEKYPSIIFIAETYNPAQYRDYIFRGHFDYLYDKVGLYDTLRAIAECKESASAITGCWQRLDGLAPSMLTFMENHDEQRLASSHVLGDATKGRPAMFVAATVSNAPTMVYFGQELGEPAEGKQGFSGDDGKTSIFDYSVVPTIQRKLNGKSTKAEKDLESFYSRLLTICRDNECIYNGTFFDLMYVNYQNQSFDHNREYAYVRRSDERILIFVANFSDEKKNNLINLPQHMFDFLGIKQGKVSATELMSGKSVKIELSAESPLKVSVPAQSGVILEVLTNVR
ncbi:MAG: alpha-amylase, partial [Paludibacteraceae bacterium]|nr:alpha-amylase [Paludibacteraceae bacterium]